MLDQVLIENVQELLEEQVTADRFSGTVLIAHNDRVILTAAGGFAIHPGILPNQPDTKFNIASVTKMFTAVAILRLAEARKLELHIPISTYNRYLPHADEITIHQLLTHTAGFDRYWNHAYRATRSDLRTVADYLKLFANEPLLFPPGTSHHYGHTCVQPRSGLHKGKLVWACRWKASQQ